MVHLDISREEQKEKERERDLCGWQNEKKRLREAEFKMCVLNWFQCELFYLDIIQSNEERIF